MFRNNEFYFVEEWMERVDVERIFFCYLAGHEMADFMVGQKPMTYEEFDKIIYLLMKLHFHDLVCELWDQYYETFEAEIEKSNEMPCDSHEEVLKYDRWMNEFCAGAPTKRLRDILGTIFEA